MVYEKHIKRGEKIYGPYAYKSKRIGSRVITEYVGKQEESTENNQQSTEKSGTKRKWTILFVVIPLIIISGILIYIFFNFSLLPTGRATLDLSPAYQINETITGNLKINLKHGELIPADSVIKVILGEQEKEIALSEIIDLGQEEGNFYAEGSGISGFGSGYGFPGRKLTTPEIFFTLLIYEEPAEEQEEEIVEEPVEEVPEENITEEQPVEEQEEPTEEIVEETPEEAPAEEQEEEIVEEPVEEQEEEIVEEPAEEPEASPITGEAITEINEISGIVKFGESFEYELKAGEKARIISVNVNGEEADENILNVEISENKAIVTTDYEGESGFGSDFLQEEEGTITINLESFGLTAEPGELQVGLIAQGEMLTSSSKQIVVEGVEEIPEENVTQVEVLENVTVANITETNVTIPKNITELNITEIKIRTNATISTTQFGARLGQTVKWKKNIKLNETGAVKVELPKLAGNITVYKVLGEIREEVEEGGGVVEEPVTLPEENVTEQPVEIPEENITEEITETGKSCEDSDNGIDFYAKGTLTLIKNKKQEEYTDYCLDQKKSGEYNQIGEYYCLGSSIKIKKEVCEFGCKDGICLSEKEVVEEIVEEIIEENITEGIIAEEITETITEQPTEIVNEEQQVEEEEPKQEITEEGLIREEVPETNIQITGQVSAEIELEKETGISAFVKKIFSFITGKAVDIFSSITGRAITTEEKLELIEVTIEENATEYEVEYETPSPSATETNITNGKQIVISGPDVLNYTNIIAFTNLPYETSSEKIKLFHLDNGTRETVNIQGYDINNNSLIDYVEWIVPHLSEQTYELIIEITKAEHLDSNRTFISDIYDYVYQLDEKWSEPIYNNEYVRVVFEQNLTSEKDITLYARNFQGENTIIQVYEFNQENLIAQFPVIDEERYYKVYMINLTGEQDTFDLRIVNLNNNNTAYLEFDHIIDPQALTGPYGGVWLKSPPNASTQTSLTVWFAANFTTVSNLKNATPYIWNSTWNLINDTQTQTISGVANLSNVSIILPKDDNYYWNYYACNASNACSFNHTNWTITVDAVYPQINITLPLNNTNSSLVNLNVNFTIVDQQACWYTNDTFKFNYTLTCGNNITTVTWSEGRHNVTAYINDSAGNLNSSSVTFTIDITAPGINLTYPLNTTYSINVSDLNYTTGADATFCMYYNGTSNATITCGVNLTGQTSSEGSQTWIVYANDSSGNQNKSSVTFFKDSIKPQINITIPLNNTNTTATGLNVNFTVSDASLQACWYTNDTFTFNYTLTCGNNITGITWSEGRHNVTAYINDSAGNVNSSSVTFTIDITSPSATIIYPANISYNVNVSELNYTYVDLNQGNCWHSTNNGTTNSTQQNPSTNFTSITSLEGSNVFTLYCNDSSGNLNTTAVTFFKDTVYPDVTIASPTAQTHTSQDIGFDIRESEAGTCLYSLDGGANRTMSGNSSLTGFTASETLSNGGYTAYAYCNDSLNNINNTVNVSFSVSYQAPGGGGEPPVTPPEECIDSCNSGEKETGCANETATRTRDCGNYDTDACSEWGEWTETSCGVGEICSSGACLISGEPRLKVELVEPVGDRDVNQGEAFTVSVKVTCENAPCGDVDVSLDPEEKEEVIEKENKITMIFKKIYEKIKSILENG